MFILLVRKLLLLRCSQNFAYKGCVRLPTLIVFMLPELKIFSIFISMHLLGPCNYIKYRIKPCTNKLFVHTQTHNEIIYTKDIKYIAESTNKHICPSSEWWVVDSVSLAMTSFDYQNHHTTGTINIARSLKVHGFCSGSCSSN